MELFVPGRLCLFGEHSDWAGSYNRINSEIVAGKAIVTGIEQGIYARVKKSELFRFRTVGRGSEWLEFALAPKHLRYEARRGGFYSYVAGTVAHMLEHYDVGGVSVNCYDITLPMGKGLSSSAAICVLVVRAFNMLYGLNLSPRGEMEAAYHGEILTPSRCGRLDQACAYGRTVTCMTFQGDDVEIAPVKVGRELHFIIADLAGKKDTRQILAELNAHYPFPQTSIARDLHRALGQENHRLVTEVVKALRHGDAEWIGELMRESQEIFTKLIAPASPNALASPLFYELTRNERVRDLALGIKGVGSHGDGYAQMICADEEKQTALLRTLREIGYQSYSLTLPIT